MPTKALRTSGRTAGLALCTAVALAHAAPAAAQTTRQLDITVGSVLYVGVSNAAVTFAPTAADLRNGSMVSPVTPTVVHAGNVRHTVRVTASSATMTAANPANIKPVSHVQWSRDGGSSWTALSTTPASMATDVTRGSHTVPLLFRATVSFLDGLDTYTTTFTFTIVAS